MGPFSHLERSKVICSGSGKVATSFVKSVGGGGSPKPRSKRSSFLTGAAPVEGSAPPGPGLLMRSNRSPEELGPPGLFAAFSSKSSKSTAGLVSFTGSLGVLGFQHTEPKVKLIRPSLWEKKRKNKLQSEVLPQHLATQTSCSVQSS